MRCCGVCIMGYSCSGGLVAGFLKLAEGKG